MMSLFAGSAATRAFGSVLAATDGDIASAMAHLAHTVLEFLRFALSALHEAHLPFFAGSFLMMEHFSLHP
jgi:hypothetical protein